MALSQADFYAYSRATGAPVPEDPQERAQMAPEVAEFRRNQLKAPEQGQQQGQNALASLAGIGALALAGVGAYQFAKGRLPKGPSRSATAPVVTEDIVREAERTGAVRRAAAETTPAPSKVATPGEPTPEERQRVYAEVAQKSPEELPRVYRPKGGTQEDLLITDPNTGEVFRAGRSPSSFAERYISLRPELKGQKTNLPLERTPGTFKEFSQEAQQFTPRQYLESTGSLEADPTDRLVAEMGEFQAARKKQLESRMSRAYGQQLEKTADDLLEQLQTTAPDLTTIQQSSAGAQQNQFINAVESGEDQITGRYKTQLQRNEDLDLTQVEALENTQGDIRVAASQLPDGLPKDQVEAIPQQTSAQRFLQNERDEIASQLGEQGLPVSPSRIEAELTNRLSGSEAWTYGPKYTQRKQALQLGATYDPRFFENLKTPSVQIAGETIPVESLKEPVIMEDTASRLQERVENKKNWLGQVRLEEQKNKVRLSKVNKEIENLNAYQEEVFNFLKSGKASPEQIKIGQQRLTDLSVDLNRLDTVQNELSNLVYTGNKRIAGAESYVKGAIGEMQLPQKLKTGVEEGMRVFYETDSAGNAIPETLELRGERPMRDLPAKGGGGRNVGEYTAGERLDEEIRAIQGGGRIRDYDPETGAAVQRWEGDKTQTGRELDIYGVRLSSERRDDPEMRPSKPGPSRTPLTRIPTEQSRESFNVARQLRQLQTSGRPGEAQEFLDKIMKQRGISGLSGTFSPL